ncbi:MAG: hypothetical protein AAF677_15445, partial [Pseudomonadota bacterium]
QSATQAATQAAPAAVAAGPGVPTIDDGFDGSDLDPRWEVLHENPGAYIVDGGALLALASGADERWWDETPDNLVALRAPLDTPGDFDMTVSGRLEAKTGRDAVWLGLYNGPQDFLAAQAWLETGGCGAALKLSIWNQRVITGDDRPVYTVFTTNLFDKNWVEGICSSQPDGRAYADQVLAELNRSGFDLTLARRGFQYTATLAMDLPAAGEIPARRASFTTRALSRVAPFGRPAFMIGQTRGAQGETAGEIDRFVLAPADE